jgi:hypothetical protein
VCAYVHTYAILHTHTSTHTYNSYIHSFTDFWDMMPSTFVYNNTTKLRHILQAVYPSARTNIHHLTFQRNVSTKTHGITLYKNYLLSYTASGPRHTSALTYAHLIITCLPICTASYVTDVQYYKKAHTRSA